jgi:hypothetical protein
MFSQLACLGGVVKFQSRQKSRRRFQPHDLFEGGAKVGVQVVQDQMDFARLGIDLQRQVSDKFHKIRLGPPPGHLHLAMTRLGFHCHEQVARSGPFVFVIFLGDLARDCRNGPTGLSQQLLALFIQANHRLRRIIRLGVKLQQVVHALLVFDGDPSDTPHYFAPRFTDVFFRICRMVSRLTPASLGRCPAAIVNSRIVQRAAPSGGWLQVKATTSAS